MLRACCERCARTGQRGDWGADARAACRKSWQRPTRTRRRRMCHSACSKRMGAARGLVLRRCLARWRVAAQTRAQTHARARCSTSARRCADAATATQPSRVGASVAAPAHVLTFWRLASRPPAWSLQILQGSRSRPGGAGRRAHWHHEENVGAHARWSPCPHASEQSACLCCVGARVHAFSSAARCVPASPDAHMPSSSHAPTIETKTRPSTGTLQ